MAKKIAWTDQAKADGRETAIDLLHRLARLLSTEEGDVKRLTDIDPPEFRLRLDDYRIRFYDQGDWIEILRVRKRKDAYRRARKTPPIIERSEADNWAIKCRYFPIKTIAVSAFFRLQSEA